MKAAKNKVFIYIYAYSFIYKILEVLLWKRNRNKKLKTSLFHPQVPIAHPWGEKRKLEKT